MPASHQLGLDLAQLRPQPLRLGDARELKASVLGLPADMREAQKPERLRLAESPRLPSLGREPAELDQARLLGRQLQVELRKPAAKLGEEPLGVITVLEADNVVVGEAHDDHGPYSPLGLFVHSGPRLTVRPLNPAAVMS